MLNCAVSGDILKKDFRLMTFGSSTGTARARLELPHQGVSSVGERGHRLTERRPPFLGEEQALAVKDANPRISTRTLHIELIMLGKLSIIGAVAAILMIPTTLSAQMGAPLIPASTLGALLIPALPFAAPSSEVSLARIWGLGARRVGKFNRIRKHTKAATKQRR
jgi:hypothetical protein